MTMTMTFSGNRALTTSGRISLAQKGLGRSSSRGGRIFIKVQKTIQSKAFILRNVGDLDRNHLEEEGNTEKQEDAIPRVLRLNGAKSVVGRVSSSAVNLAVGVATVSSAHAMVDLTPDGKVMVTDLTSTNGTYIDGEELLPGIPQELTEGGEVIFGDEHCARFELVVEP
jgi:pSer/pThr/pTyr-binding forkhead associated (FHA) protein|tara:strand:+ start:285 stop:791 length:507 start_codon:yes stop_codon:yes gene_type:complete